MLSARILVGSLEAQVFAPFALKDVCKTLPGRSWDKLVKCWVIPSVFVDEAANVLRAAGCVVYVTRPNGQPWTSGRAGAGHRSSPGDRWAELLLEAVGPQRADTVFRALTRILHPDAGGDLVLMKQLNAARDRVESRRAS